jgi:hypothetical protein
VSSIAQCFFFVRCVREIYCRRGFLLREFSLSLKRSNPPRSVVIVPFRPNEDAQRTLLEPFGKHASLERG